jgi:NAD(P)-dependent dehydrogenase (short-subunit alcohol dehydrogenase family)
MSETWVITGAGRGLGRELARQLGARGVEVIGTAREASSADEVLDVADPKSVAEFARRLGERPIDALVNNAGRQYRASSLEELDFDELSDVFEVNTLGPLRVTRALLPNLRAGRRRLVVQMSSRMGCFGEFDAPNMFGYRASKAALNMLHRCVAAELESEGFRCVALHPGWVRTDMGGPGATLSVEESVEGMLDVLDNLRGEDNGALLDWTGKRLPW